MDTKAQQLCENHTNSCTVWANPLLCAQCKRQGSLGTFNGAISDNVDRVSAIVLEMYNLVLELSENIFKIRQFENECLWGYVW